MDFKYLTFAGVKACPRRVLMRQALIARHALIPLWQAAPGSLPPARPHAMFTARQGALPDAGKSFRLL